MRNFIGLALLVSLVSLAAFAQEGGNTPKAEIFGGYQYTRFDGGVNANGWNTSLTGNLNNWFGIAADFSGAYKTQNGVSFNNYTYTFGPVISYRHNDKFTPFAHFLAGGNHASASISGVGSGSDNGFAMMFGGGLDVKASQHLALRAVQFDWLSLHSNGASDNNNMRISTGILFRY
jgi:outer membrane protein with beta-barrel domain